MKKTALLLLTSLFFAPFYAQEAPWQDLFNGQNLQEFDILNGTAEYRLEDGQIIGVSKMGTPNTFLATRKHYGDFILEFEVMIDPSLNSGVQIRSNSLPDYKKGKVHGYQVEIDPSPRAFSGGIYDEGRRAWLYPLARNPKGRAAFRNGQWNQYRVEAIGSNIRTWVNGIQCAYLADDLTAKGFIALQVHSIGDKQQEGKEIRWRNLRVLTEEPAKYSWPEDPQLPQISFLHNQLTEWEKRHGWHLLWDGTSSSGWQSARGEPFPASGWEMKDGILSVLSNEDSGRTTRPGDIITIDQFSDFELELEFMLTKGANSGIKYFVHPDVVKEAAEFSGCEYQLLDDQNHQDAKEGIAGNHTLASLYDLIPADNISIPGRGKQFKGVGAWNKARIVSRNGQVEHWLNGEKTLEYNRWTQMFQALVRHSKYKDWEDFGQWPMGHILLQDHDDTVRFKNIKIREF